jgi:hypothetical protein
MNYSTTRIILLAGAALLATAPTSFAQTHKRASAPVVITPPAVPDGSNRSRAPFPAARRENDVTPPNGEAFDQNVPPNTPSTTPDPVPPPAPTVAILQPKVAPGLMPTGHPTTSAAMTLDATHLAPTIQSTSFESRDDLIDNVRVRVRQSNETISEFRRSRSEMSSEGRSQFDAAADEVKSAEKTLEKSIRRAERASSTDWEQARAQLASDYQAYAAALARVDAAAGIAPAQIQR